MSNMSKIFDCLYSVYSDSNIYSRYYFKAVLQKMLFDYDYTLFYADFRELGKANHILGMTKTDKLMGDSLKTAISVLPECISARIAGDEFLFIVPTNSLEKSSLEYVNDINIELAKKSYDEITPYMDFVCTEDKKGTYLNSAFDIANDLMDDIKLKKDDYEIVSNEPQFTQLIIDLKNLLANFRIYQIKDQDVFNETSQMLFTSLREVYSNTDYYINKVKEYNTLDIPKNKALSIEDGLFYQHFHRAIEEEDNVFFYDNITRVREVNDKLKVNDVTGYYNKLYYNDNFCRNNNDKKYYGLYIEIEGLKTANTLFGHDNADILLKKIYNIINRNFKGKDVHCFDFLSAKCLILSENKEDIDNNNLNKCFDYINNNVFADFKFHLLSKTTENKFSPIDMYSMVQLYDTSSGKQKDENRKQIIENDSGKMVMAVILGDTIKDLQKRYSYDKGQNLLEQKLYEEILRIQQKLLEITTDNKKSPKAL